MQVPGGKNGRSRNLTLELECVFTLTVGFYIRVNGAICKHISTGNVRCDSVVLIATIAVCTSSCYWTLTAIREAVTAMQVSHRIVVKRMVRGDIEVADMVKLTAERALRQRELQAIKEPAIETRNFGLTITGQCVGSTDTRANLVFPAPFKVDVILVKGGNCLLFQAKAQIQSQAAGGLPFILKEEGVG